ncbi:MAG: NYN domain-containing protein [Burkholderiales bacterium]|nr:NYN domain-containing protein [Burkholderiales bacterium]
MASQHDHISMALFCDFENVALGVRDANYDKFDIKRVLERLLLKGSIVVKKAYCDWERYKGFKAPMHEANFELIEIPHVRQSGKNSADIRLVVDALDLCYTKAHVNTFVIISGDSDFSPLVSKLRENAKHVIGVGVKQSTSDLLIANCDEFIFYDDLVRESQRQAARRSNGQGSGRDAAPQPRRSPEEDRRRREEMDARRLKAVEMAAETYEALVTDRDDGGRIWASVLKEAIKRRNPGFSESYYGFRTFGNLLEEAQGRGLLEFGRDEKSGTWVARGTGVPNAAALARHAAQAAHAAEAHGVELIDDEVAPLEPEHAGEDDHPTERVDAGGEARDARDARDPDARRRGRRGRGGRAERGERTERAERTERGDRAPTASDVSAPAAAPAPTPTPEHASATPAAPAEAPARPARKAPARKRAAAKSAAPANEAQATGAPAAAIASDEPPPRKQAARKTPARKSSGRTRAPKPTDAGNPGE